MTWLLVSLIAACTPVKLASGEEVRALQSELERASLVRDKLARLERFAGSRALTAGMLLALLDALPHGTDRWNAEEMQFPYVVDKDNFPRRPPWYVQVPDRVQITGGTGYIMSGAAAYATGLPIPPLVCLELAAISERAFSSLCSALRGELASNQVKILRGRLGNALFDDKQAAALLSLISHREERIEAAWLLRPRVTNRTGWNERVCSIVGDMPGCRFDEP